MSYNLFSISKNSTKLSLYFSILFIFSIFLLIGNVFCESIETEDIRGDPYFGVPLGALHYSAEGTSAEIYAADEFSIIFNHFEHNPRQIGCTAMIIGPPRPEDNENIIPDHGIILPMIASFKTKREKRETKNKFINNNYPKQFDGFWPIEFAHLLLEPKDNKEEKEVKTFFNSNNLTTNNIYSFNNSTTFIPNIQKQQFVNNSINLFNNQTITTTTTIPTTTTTITKLNNNNLNNSTTTIHSSLTTQPLLLLGNKRTNNNNITINSTPSIIQRNYSLNVLNAKDDAIIDDKIEKGIGGNIRRSPARNEYEGNNAIKDSKPLKEITTTPLYKIINDPRPGRRQRLIELRKKLDPNYISPIISTTSAPFSEKEINLILPKVNGQLVTFTLTNGAKITQYKWIGLWNQCTKRQIPLVSLVDIDPPREEKIMPLSGWSHNVTSYRLHILNCNTILIPSFHYDGRNTTKNTYFFFGVGQFPEAVEYQLKANIVGQREGDAIKSYSGEDVLLRLPRPYRTFDIDFISIFNTDEQKSFGHVLIPSLLVPPC